MLCICADGSEIKKLSAGQLIAFPKARKSYILVKEMCHLGNNLNIWT